MTRSQRPVWLGEDGRGWDHARIHRQLLEDDRLGVYEVGIYVGLAIHAETMTGSCRPAAATLAKYVKCSERRAREALDRLEEAGYVRVEEQVGKASTYHLLPPPTLAPRAGVPDADPGTSRTDPGTTTRTTPAPRADEQEPENETTPPPPPRDLMAALEESLAEAKIQATCRVIAERALANRRGEPLTSRRKWKAKVAKEAYAEHHAAAAALLAADPSLTAQQLASRLEGSPPATVQPFKDPEWLGEEPTPPEVAYACLNEARAVIGR